MDADKKYHQLISALAQYAVMNDDDPLIEFLDGYLGDDWPPANHWVVDGLVADGNKTFYIGPSCHVAGSRAEALVKALKGNAKNIGIDNAGVNWHGLNENDIDAQWLIEFEDLPYFVMGLDEHPCTRCSRMIPRASAYCARCNQELEQAGLK